MRRLIVTTMLVLVGGAGAMTLLPIRVAGDTSVLDVVAGSGSDETSSVQPRALGNRAVRDEPDKPIDREIQDLRENVSALHRDVKRLIELLEKQPVEVAANAEGNPGQGISAKQAKPDSDSVKSHDEGETRLEHGSLDAVPKPEDLNEAERSSPSAAPDVDYRDIWKLTLSEAVQIGLQNSRVIRDLGGVTSHKVADSAIIHISRLNADTSEGEFAASVTNLVSNVEDAYWRLWAAHRNLDAAKEARDVSQQTWNDVYERFKGGIVSSQEEAQSREQYFHFRSRLEQSLHDLYEPEAELRRVLGIAQDDGRLIRPQDEPVADEVTFDWKAALASALANNVDMVRQRHKIQELELQHAAARGRLPKDLLAELRSTEEVLDPEFALPQVRRLVVDLAREKAWLKEMEQNASHLLSRAFRNMVFSYQLAATLSNRLKAAKAEVASATVLYERGKTTLSVLLDAQRRLAQNSTDYNDALAQHGLAVKDIHFRKESLLAYRGIKLADAAASGAAGPTEAPEVRVTE